MKASVSVQPVKHTLVTEILDNGTYTPASGLWCRLYNRLMALSVDDLKSLRMFIYLKMSRVMQDDDDDKLSDPTPLESSDFPSGTQQNQ